VRARLLVLCALLGDPLFEPPTPLLRVAAGTVRMVAAGAPRTVEPRSGSVSLGGQATRVESGAQSSFALQWRGLGSVTLEGPAALVLGAGPRLELETCRTAEVELRRGHLTLELVGLGTLELAAGVLQVRALPDGGVEVLNRGGADLELLRPDSRGVLRIAAGERLRLRAVAAPTRTSPGAAGRRQW
jgi:hypothetical protein